MLGKLNRYVARLSIFLITVALIAGVVGCGPTQYKLTISSTEGGQVTIPGEDTFTYEEKRSVDLVAQAEEGYQFVNWTGNVTTIANVNAAITTITVDGDYSITANFAPEISENLEIWDWYDLNAIRDNLSGSYILMNDLGSTTAGYEELASDTANGGKGWEPIGTSDDQFTGSFDGQGYEIEDLFIDRPEEDYVGLFGYVGRGGAVQNVGVVNATVAGNGYVGGLVGRSGGIDDSGRIFEGTVGNSYSTGNVTDGGWGWVGGLIGGNAGTVSKSYSTGNVTGHDYVGGLVGYNWRGTVSNSYSTGSVTCVQWDSSECSGGGLVSVNNGTVSNSLWDMQASGQAASDGGTGKTTAEMQDIDTFTDTETEGLDEPWDIIAVAPGETNGAYTWNIIDGETYPFLGWQP